MKENNGSNANIEFTSAGDVHFGRATAIFASAQLEKFPDVSRFSFGVPHSCCVIVFLFFSCGEIFEITVKMEINLLITWWKLLIDTGIRHKKSAQKINDSQNLIIDSWKSLSAPAFELTQKFRLTSNRVQRRPNPFENSVCTVIFESISAFFSASRSSVIDCRMSVQLMQMQIGIIIARFTLN